MRGIVQTVWPGLQTPVRLENDKIRGFIEMTTIIALVLIAAAAFIPYFALDAARKTGG